MIKGKFIDNLPKIYGIYTGGFIVFIILMAIAEQVTKVHATCDETGEPALYSYRKIENSETIMIGEKKEYMPLSRKAYISKIRKK